MVDNMTRPSLATAGAALVSLCLALAAVASALLASVTGSFALRITLIVLAAVLIAATGATLVPAIARARSGNPP